MLAREAGLDPGIRASTESLSCLRLVIVTSDI